MKVQLRYQRKNITHQCIKYNLKTITFSIIFLSLAKKKVFTKFFLAKPENFSMCRGPPWLHAWVGQNVSVKILKLPTPILPLSKFIMPTYLYGVDFQYKLNTIRILRLSFCLDEES